MAANQRISLLVVDDEQPQLEALCHVLHDLGHEVTGHSNAAEALGSLQAGSFDVLLSDLSMPEMDGIELVERSLKIDPDLVPVLMTGNGTIDSAVAAMRVGALDYILKPFRLEAIRPVIARAAQIRRLRMENRRLHHDLASKARQLEAVNAELDAFAGRVAHDLRAPINIINGFAAILEKADSARLDDKERAFLRRISEAGGRADRIVRSLLNFARSGERALALKAIALGPLVERARHVVEGDLTSDSRRTEWIFSDLPEVKGDDMLLEQVFVNLLSNAMKFTRKTADPRIEVGCVSRAGAHEVYIRDNGAGFDPAMATHLFRPFTRLHQAADFEGTGMGLANVHRIMQRHGGSVRATSRPGEGAEFVLAFAC